MTGWHEAGRLAGGRQAGTRQASWQEAGRLAGGRQAGRRQTEWHEADNWQEVDRLAG
jgi:hypothetical protein